MAYTRSFFFKFIGEYDVPEEVELCVLLGKDGSVDPSTLSDPTFTKLLKPGLSVTNRLKAKFHTILTYLNLHTGLPPLPYWVNTHQRIMFRSDALHHNRYDPSIWNSQCVSIILDFFAFYGRFDATDIWLQYDSSIKSTSDQAQLATLNETKPDPVAATPLIDISCGLSTTHPVPDHIEQIHNNQPPAICDQYAPIKNKNVNNGLSCEKIRCSATPREINARAVCEEPAIFSEAPTLPQSSMKSPGDQLHFATLHEMKPESVAAPPIIDISCGVPANYPVPEHTEQIHENQPPAKRETKPNPGLAQLETVISSRELTVHPTRKYMQVNLLTEHEFFPIPEPVGKNQTIVNIKDPDLIVVTAKNGFDPLARYLAGRFVKQKATNIHGKRSDTISEPRTPWIRNWTIYSI